MSLQLESIKLKLAGIAKDVISDDKEKLIFEKICSRSTLYKYLVKGDANNYTICRNIYIFLNNQIALRQAELDKI